MSRYAEFQARFDGKGRPSDFHRALAELSDYIRSLSDVNDLDEVARCHVLYTETLQWLLGLASPAYFECKLHMEKRACAELPS